MIDPCPPPPLISLTLTEFHQILKLIMHCFILHLHMQYRALQTRYYTSDSGAKAVDLSVNWCGWLLDQSLFIIPPQLDL